MQIAQSSLVIVGLNTPTVKLFWNGIDIPNVTDILADWESDEQHIKIKVSAELPIHTELRDAGINVKVGGVK
jgi:hypothetical protein